MNATSKRALPQADRPVQTRPDDSGEHHCDRKDAAIVEQPDDDATRRPIRTGSVPVSER